MDDTQSGDNNSLYSSLDRDPNVDNPSTEQFNDEDSEGSVFTSFMKQPSGEKSGLLGGLRSSSAEPSLGGLRGTAPASPTSDQGPRLFSSYINSDEEELIDQSSDIPVLSDNQKQSDVTQPDISQPADTNVMPAEITDTTTVGELSENSFPLFLSFKANDNIASVSDALREKAIKTTPPSESKEIATNSLSPSTSVIEETAKIDEPVFDDLDDFDMDQDLLSRPIFKPVQVTGEDAANETNSVVSKEIPATAVSEDSSETVIPSDNNIPALDFPDVFSVTPAVLESEESIPEPSVEPAEDSSPVIVPETPDTAVTSAMASAPAIPGAEPLFFTDDDKPVFKPFRSQRSVEDTDSVTETSSANADNSPSYDIPSIKNPATAPDSIPLMPAQPPAFIPVFQPPKNTERPGSKDKLENAAAKERSNERPGAKERSAERQAAMDARMERPGGHDHKDQRAHVIKPTPNKPSQAAKVAQEDVQTSERSISNRYTAAQQMGRIAPLPARDIKASRKKGSHLPILFALLSVAFVVSIFSLWIFLDIGSILFGNNAKPTPTSSVATSSVTAVATTTETTQDVTTQASSEVTTAATTTKETTAATTTEQTTAATTKETTKETTAATTKETTAATTKETTAATTKATTTKSVSSTSATIPSAFATTITDGKSSADTASFNINFKNTGASDVSLLDGVENITVTFVTNGAVIESVTSDDFVFTPKEGKTNVFIGVPVSTDIIKKTETKTVTVSAVSEDDVTIGKYSVKYYVLCYS